MQAAVGLAVTSATVGRGGSGGRRSFRSNPVAVSRITPVLDYCPTVDALLRATDLEVSYGDHVAVTGVTLSVGRGETLAVIGPNGSGKSTLLLAIAGLIAPSSGTVECMGTTALVLQSTDVDRGIPLTVLDTVRMARYPRLGLLRRFGDDDRHVVSSALARVEATELAERQLQHLSGGQRQRVLVAQGIAQEADLVLLDEPVTGLDIASRKTILDVIDSERKEGRSVVMTTHNLEDARTCDRVLLLATCMVALGPPDEVIREEHLRTAFGGRVIRVGGELVMDDPHHHHDH